MPKPAYYLLSDDEKKKILIRKLTQKSQYPYYRFTEKCYDINDAITWFNHFSKKDIPCCIVRGSEENSKIRNEEKRNKPENKNDFYTVWVWGIEYTSINQSGAVESFPNKECIDSYGDIIIETSSFKKLINEYNEVDEKQKNAKV